MVAPASIRRASPKTLNWTSGRPNFRHDCLLRTVFLACGLLGSLSWSEKPAVNQCAQNRRQLLTTFRNIMGGKLQAHACP